MSKRQGDGWKTETNKSLNEYYDKVFLPKFIEMENEQIKKFYINGGLIICEQKNIVAQDGWKLKGLKLTGEKRYIIRVFSDDKSGWADATEQYNDKNKANERFQFWKAQLEM